MSANLDDAILQHLAQKACWYVDCDFRDNADSCVLTGDGVDDLDQLLRIIDTNPHMRMTLDVGQTNSIYRPVVREDIVALREAYVAVWGETNKPAFWNDPKGVPSA